MLVQCGHDVAEALRRMSLNVIPLEKSLSVWSEDETLKFEMGLLISGKNFHAIQKEVLYNYLHFVYIFIMIMTIQESSLLLFIHLPIIISYPEVYIFY